MGTSDETEVRGSMPLAKGALTLGIISLLTSLIIYVSVPLGALAILLALLSRADTGLIRQAKIGLGIGLAAIILSASMTGYAFYTVQHDPALRQQIDDMVSYYMDLYETDAPQTDAPVIQEPDDFFIQETPAPQQNSPDGGSFI